MATFRRALAVFMAVLVSGSPIGCGSDSEPAQEGHDAPIDAVDLLDSPNEVQPDLPIDSADEWRPQATVVRYDLSTSPLALPFPYDFYTLSDSDSATGLRVHMDGEAYSNAIVAEMFRLVPAAFDVFDQAQGFGPYGWCSIELTGRPPVGWTQAPESPLAQDAPVKLLAWDGNEITGASPFRATLVSASDRSGTPRFFLDLLPVTPLADSSRHLVVITTALNDADGQPVAPDMHFAMVAGLAEISDEDPLAERLRQERDRLQPALDALETYGIEPNRLAVAIDITIAPARADILAIGQQFAQDGDLATVEYTFDPDDDGWDNLTWSGEAGFPGGAAGGQIELVIEGEFQRRDFRDPDYLGGVFRLDSESAPILHHREPISFWLALPGEPEGGPFPLVILVHGLNSSKEGVWSLARILAESGIASMAFDLPEHGSDGPGTTAFMPLTEPLIVRDNFRQAGIDVLTAALLVRRWLDEGLDFLPRGGDGLPDLAAERFGLLGHSLGSMVGIMACALDAEPGAAVYAAGGGGLLYFIDSFLERAGLTDLVSGILVHAFKISAGHLFGPGDPIVYAQYCRPTPLAWVEQPQQVLMVQMATDEVMPNATVEQTAVAMQLPQIEPVVRSVEGLMTVQADGHDSGLIQYDGGDHAFIFPGGSPPELVPIVQAQMVHYLYSYLHTGTAEIIHPYEL